LDLLGIEFTSAEPGSVVGCFVVRSDLCTLGGSASAAAVMSFSITRFAVLRESKRGVGQ
jgi:hypothetical protein